MKKCKRYIYNLYGEDEHLHEHIRKRCVQLGELIIKNGETVRALAKRTGYSKSTIHKDLTERLVIVNEALAMEVRKVLHYNKSIRHLRGGEATRIKWQQKNNQENPDS